MRFRCSLATRHAEACCDRPVFGAPSAELHRPPDSPAQAPASRVFSLSSSPARLGAPEASVWLPDCGLKRAAAACARRALPT